MGKVTEKVLLNGDDIESHNLLEFEARQILKDCFEIPNF
jgi:hypothetical protein